MIKTFDGEKSTDIISKIEFGFKITFNSNTFHTFALKMQLKTKKKKEQTFTLKPRSIKHSDKHSFSL